MTQDHHQQPAQGAQVLYPLPLAAYLHEGDLEPDQDQDKRLTEDEVCILRVDALLDAIIDGRPWTVQDDLRFLLAGPFGVDWRAGHPPTEAPATSWEPTVLELGQAVAEALHLDPLWADDPADYA
jgi:hypothetical protein